jgi:hypothetical protein
MLIDLECFELPRIYWALHIPHPFVRCLKVNSQSCRCATEFSLLPAIRGSSTLDSSPPRAYSDHTVPTASTFRLCISRRAYVRTDRESQTAGQRTHPARVESARVLPQLDYYYSFSAWSGPSKKRLNPTSFGRLRAAVATNRSSEPWSAAYASN